MLGNRFFPVVCAVLIAFIGSGCDQSQKTAEVKVDETGLCDFHSGPCSQTIGENIITLELNPANAPSEKPLKFNLKFSSPVVIGDSRIEGRDMFMGLIPIKWQQQAESHYQASAIYGSCASGYMVWRLMVSFTDEQGLTKQAWFDFLADNPKS